METISMAMEKVRREQLAGGFSHTSDLLAVASSLPSRPAGSIIYHRTRILPVDHEHLARNRIVALDKGNPACVSVDLLRTQVLQKMDDNGWRTVAVTSPTAGAGKTVVATNLAISIAQQTSRTALLADFDLRRPRVAQCLGLAMADARSLNDLLNESAGVDEALVNPGIPRFVCLPAARAEATPAELLASRRTAELITELRDRYSDRVVVFDLPALLRPDDAMAVLPRIDCVLMVIGEGMSRKADIETSLRQLPPSNMLGLVLNKAERAWRMR